MASPHWTSASPSDHADPFIKFISANPTTFHTVAYFADRLKSHDFVRLSERDDWSSTLKRGGKYFVERNGSSLYAFTIGEQYEVGNGAAVVASHVDALAARVKPIPKLEDKGGYVQLGMFLQRFSLIRD
jgi:aminopeptidase I